MYTIIRSIFFRFDPEKVHYFSMNLIRFFCRFKALRSCMKLIFQRKFPVNALGIPFINPVGLGAGFDKNAAYLTELECLGFGFVEIGTVTPIGQEGNEKPRLFRLPQDKALINRMGFNNDGVDIIANRLKNWRAQHPNSELIIGGNIGKNKVTPNDEAWKDYETCFLKLFDYVDYFVVNVSSPNTPGLRALQDKDSLKIIFTKLNQHNALKEKPKPILLKIAPDLEEEQVNDIVDLFEEVKIDGLIISNTTIDRSGLHTSSAQISEIGAGGLSGKPVMNKSTALIRQVKKLSPHIFVIGSGGIFNGEDAKGKIKSGSTLIQVWTGFIYVGPGIVKKIIHTLKYK
jgi:dihydroorotate dehydrogenase